MKVWIRIIGLLLATIAGFVAGLAALKYWEWRSFQTVAATRAEERHAAFDAFLAQRRESLETLATDYGSWDEMVRAIMAEDRAWAERTFTVDVLAGYKANAVWIYDVEFEPLYTANNLYTDKLSRVPVPPEALAVIFSEKKIAHFFAETPLGIMEIQGASVHGSRDAQRLRQPSGYLLAGRLWSDADVREMELLTGNAMQLARGEAGSERSQADRRNGAVAFTRVLAGWDGAPVAVIHVSNESPVFTGLSTWSRRLYLWLIFFAVALVAMLSYALIRWVARPLRHISDSLQHEDAAPLARLKNEGTEFGAIARLIADFFAQRSDLLREVNERRQAEQALEMTEEHLRHAQKLEAVGRLAGGIAHDFNNLLTAILGYAEILELRLAGDPESAQHAQMIRKAGGKASGLTRQLLAFSRKQILQPRVIDLCSLVTDMEKLLSRLISEQIDLRVECADEDLRVLADPGQLEQVMLNLAVNARDAMPRGGVLTIRCATAVLDGDGSARAADLPDGDYVELSVRDTGEGMDAETRSRVFEPFFTTKPAGQGTGLGLATVYGIVKQTGGGILLESEPGEGATFSIYLPRADGEVEAEEDLAPVRAERPASGTVLVAEDEELVRELLCETLRREGYAVLCGRDGVEALEIARGHAGWIDLLVSDIVMPRMEGGDLAVALRALWPELPVLFVTGYSDRLVEEGVAPVPGAEVLEKPFSSQELVRNVRAMLGEKT